MEELTPEEINVLKEYINTESGKKFLLKLVNYETSLLAQSFGPKVTTEEQIQKVNRVSGIYWVRTLIQDLVTPKK